MTAVTVEIPTVREGAGRDCYRQLTRSPVEESPRRQRSDRQSNPIDCAKLVISILGGREGRRALTMPTKGLAVRSGFLRVTAAVPRPCDCDLGCRNACTWCEGQQMGVRGDES